MTNGSGLSVKRRCVATRWTALFLAAAFLLGAGREAAGQPACIVPDASSAQAPAAPGEASRPETAPARVSGEPLAAHHDHAPGGESPRREQGGEQVPPCTCGAPHPASRSSPLAPSGPSVAAVTLPVVAAKITSPAHEVHLGRLPFRILPFANGPPQLA